MSLNAEYTYTSLLPLMFSQISHRPSNSTGPNFNHKMARYEKVGRYNGSGMSIMQKRLWELVWHMREKVNVDPERAGESAAVRQWWVERGVWGVYWPDKEFPGIYPVRMNPTIVPRDQDGKIIQGGPIPIPAQQQTLPPNFQTSISGLNHTSIPSIHPRQATKPHIPFLTLPPSTSQFTNTITPYNYKSAHLIPNIQLGTKMNEGRNRMDRLNAYDVPESYAIQVPHTSYPVLNTRMPLHDAILNPTSHPAELNLSPMNINTILTNIMRYKPAHYVPIHGWDPNTQLPRYCILNLAADGHAQFFGPKGGDGRFQRVREEWLLFRIMFQRLDHGAVAVWAEGRTREMGREMATGVGSAWEAFKLLWAFLRSWAEHGNTTGWSENIVEHLVNCRDVWEDLDISGLEPPPLPKQYHTLPQIFNSGAPVFTDTLDVAGSGGYAQTALDTGPTGAGSMGSNGMSGGLQIALGGLATGAVQKPQNIIGSGGGFDGHESNANTESFSH